MPAQAHIKERITRFPAMCKAAGLKVTHQRTAIYAMLAGSKSHPSPEEVYSSIRRQLPSISLATVYKVLDLFYKHGFLRKVSTEGQVARYDANTESHHHLICSNCGTIQDVHVSLPVDSLQTPNGENFAVSHWDIIFHGLCRRCQDGKAAAHA